MKRPHYSEATFIQTDRNPAYDGSAADNRVGYCSVCLCDMQSFGKSGANGSLRHYNSHRCAVRLAMWGKRKKVAV